MPNILKMAAFSLSTLRASIGNEEPPDDRGEMLAFTLLLSAHVANVGLVLMSCFPAVMEALARNRNAAVLVGGSLCLPYYYLIRRLIRGARTEFAEDEVAASEAERRWRLPTMLYLVASWMSFVWEIAVLASRKGHH